MFYNYLHEKIIYQRDVVDEFFTIFHCGVTCPDEKYEFYHTGSAPYHVFECVTSGHGFFEYADRVFPLSAGDFYFLNKTAAAHFYPDSAEPYEKIFISVYGTLIDHLVELYFGDAPMFIAHVDASGYFREISGLLDAITPENRDEALRRAAVLIFDMISFATAERKHEVATKLELLPQRIRSYMEDNLYSDVSLDDIARNFNLSGTHIIRVFKAEYGMTPMKYLVNMRISQARVMLTETSLGIKEIAYKLRFAESHHFSHAFRKYVGMTPSEYRYQERHYLIDDPTEKNANGKFRGKGVYSL